MNQAQTKFLKEYIPFLFKVLLFLSIAVGILFIFCFIPMFYDRYYGDKIIQTHIQEVVGNKTNDGEVANALMQWVNNNVVYPTDELKVNILGITFFKIHNETKFFWRDVPASWTIIRRMGMCGEDANYFVGVMTKLGYKARKIEPTGPKHWDHAWAEYYNSQGIQIVLDPSSNQIISPNLHKWVENKTFEKIEAIDINGKKEDVTKEYTN